MNTSSSMPRLAPARPDDSTGAAERAVALAIDAHCDRPGALLPMLHAIQDALGFVPDDAVPRLARALNLSRAEVHGVLTYYHDFRRTPPGRHVVRICRAEACQACGSEALLSHAAALLGCAPGGTRDDGEVTLETVDCLGLCASSPALQIDGRLHARVTASRLEALVRDAGVLR